MNNFSHSNKANDIVNSMANAAYSEIVSEYFPVGQKSPLAKDLESIIKDSFFIGYFAAIKGIVKLAQKVSENGTADK